MMTKPPGFASTSTLPMDDEEEESIDESLDEILLEAHDPPVESAAKSLDGGSSAGELPGVSRVALSEVTVLAPRPIFPDELVDEPSDDGLGDADEATDERITSLAAGVKEEETKVEPYETAIRAAASRDDRLLGLSGQASEQRDRALRKSTPVATRSLARPVSDSLEFEDPEPSSAQGGDADDRGVRTPADIAISDEDESSPMGGYLANSSAAAFQPRLPPPLRTSPPPGRPDIYPGRRIPTPNSDFLSAPTVPGFGGFGSGAHYPSIAIPAPSANDTSTRTKTALTDNGLRLPIGGLAGFVLTAFAGGLLMGALIWRGHGAAPAAESPLVSHVVPHAPADKAQAIQAIVVKPVPPATAPSTPPAVATGAAAAAPSMPTLSAQTPPGVDPAVAAAAEAAAKAERRSARTKKAVADDDANATGADAPAPAPKPSAKSGSKGKKTPVVWQDPFAQ